MMRKFILESSNPGKICFDSLCDKICNIVDDMPNKDSKEFVDAFNADFDNCKFNLGFTEEIKDGRSPKFNVSFITKKLNKSTFKCKGAGIYVNSIKFLESTNQPSDYNIYRNYWFELNITFKYD